MRSRLFLIPMLALLASKPGFAADPAPEQPKSESSAETRLLEIGKLAPDFTLPLANGGEVTLGNLLKFGKAVLVGFWAIKPESGGSDMAKLQKLHEQLESKGLSTVAINPVDEAPAVSKFIEAGGLQFLVALDGKETNRAVTGRYRARTLPVFYLLDPEGKVLWRSAGLKETTLREALDKAGVR